MSRHKLAPTATAALGRTLLGATLLGAYRKEEEKIQVRLEQRHRVVCRASALGQAGAGAATELTRDCGRDRRNAAAAVEAAAASTHAGQGMPVVLKLPACCRILSCPVLTCSCTPLQIQFRGDGPLGGILAVADTQGQVKGKVGNPAADPPLRPDGKLAVGAAVGQGQLCVTRSHPGQPRPYTGVVNIVSGEVAEDLATYLVS
jgi:redox-regulated HSP33 family molecular chaperone